MGCNTVNLFVGPFNINFCTEKKKKTYRLANSADWNDSTINRLSCGGFLMFKNQH